MCLILFAQGVHPDYPLIVAANRDEFHARPTRGAHFWPDHPDILAGRDLQANGTWMGVNRNGRFAAVTNFTEPPPEPMPPRTRGDLVADFLIGAASPEEYLTGIAQHAQEFRGFNLLVGSAEGLWYLSNRDGGIKHLLPGIYGLSNHLLDTAWHRVQRGKTALADFERAEAHPDMDVLLALLGDETEPRDEELDSVVPGSESPGAVAPCFIRADVYGTRSSTVLLVGRDGQVHFRESRFGPSGTDNGHLDERFHVGAQGGSAVPGETD